MGPKEVEMINPISVPIEVESQRIYHTSIDENEVEDRPFTKYFPYYLLMKDTAELLDMFGGKLGEAEVVWMQEMYRQLRTFQEVKKVRSPPKSADEQHMITYMESPELNYLFNKLLFFPSPIHDKKHDIQPIRDTLNSTFEYEISPLREIRKNKEDPMRFYCTSRGRVLSDKRGINQSSCIFEYSPSNWLDRAVIFSHNTFYYFKAYHSQDRITHFDLFVSHLAKQEGTNDLFYQLKRYTLKY